MQSKKIYKSPIGFIILEAVDGWVTGIFMLDDKEVDSHIESENDNENSMVINECIKQIDEYFDGKRKNFDFKFKNSGTEFRQKVWDELQRIPYGTTLSYKDLAVLVNNPKAVRAVGGANHNNNLSIVVPCHRVIGADGSLTGYAGGLWRKKWLLEHEKRHY